MNKLIRTLRPCDAASYGAVVQIVTAALMASNNQAFLYIPEPAEQERILGEGRVLGYFVNNTLLGAVTVQKGDIGNILRTRFPDVTNIPASLGTGVYTSAGLVLPAAQGRGIMTSLLLQVARLNVYDSVFGTVHHANEQQKRIRSTIGSLIAGTLHAPKRPTMILYKRPAEAHQPASAKA